MDAGEEELYRFGPMGISISFARPGLFAWSRQNSTEVVLTSRRIYGTGRVFGVFGLLGAGKKPVFDVPLQEIVAVEPADFIGNRAVWIRYRGPDGEREVSIIGSALCHGRITRLVELLRPLVPGKVRD